MVINFFLGVLLLKLYQVCNHINIYTGIYLFQFYYLVFLKCLAYIIIAIPIIQNYE